MWDKTRETKRGRLVYRQSHKIKIFLVGYGWASVARIMVPRPSGDRKCPETENDCARCGYRCAPLLPYVEA